MGFGGLDWVVLAAYAGLLLGIGFHFSRRQKTTEEYFTGGRHINPVLAGISVFAAYFSIISYTAAPGEYIQYGPGQILIGQVLSYIPVYFLVGFFIIPVIMRLPITSTFELLEGRLGRTVRQACSVSYILGRLFWMGMILYTCSGILVRVLDCDLHWGRVIAISIGAVTTTYTLVGGIRTVMVTEALQSTMLMFGALLTIGLVSWRLGGVAAWFPHHWEPHWPPQPLFSADLHTRTSLIPAIISLVVGGISYTVTDQASVQRLLTTRNAVTARKAYLLSILYIVAACIVLSLVGAALLAYFRHFPGKLPPHMTAADNGDAFFPIFLSHDLPHGLSGLIIASLFAAAMSCIAGGLNAVTTVVTKDLIEPYSRHSTSEAAKMRATRWLVAAIGVAATVLSIVMGSVSGNLNEVANKTLNLLVCPTFGLFFLAIFVPFATPFGAIIGAVYSTTTAVLVAYWDVFTGEPKISFLWIMPFSFAMALGASTFFSLAPTRGRSARVIAAYAAASILPLALAVTWLLRHFA